jgi:monoamine oxidase
MLSSLRQLLRADRAANHEQKDLRSILDSKPTRRQVLKGIGAAAILAKAAKASPVTANKKARIAIVGGGIAGLNAALTLQDAGLSSSIYEASPIVGGRIHSNASTWADGQTSEWCGEFIDSGHAAMIALAQRFGLTLVDEVAAQNPAADDTLYFFESYYGTKQALKDFRQISKQLEHDASNLFPVTFDPATQTARGKFLDHLSAYDWIEQFVPGGHDSPLGAYIDSAYTNEFGLDTDQQSSLNVVFEMGFQDDPKVFSIYGESDQRFHVLGGNDRIPFAIANVLPKDSIHTGWWMESIRKKSDGTFSLSFGTAQGAREVAADHVILTVPFGVLRGLDFSQAGFDSLKKTAIQELGYGTNSKLALQCTERLWDQNGPWGLGDGNMYTDLFFQNTWDSARGIPGKQGVLVAFMGGSSGLRLGGAPSPFADARSSPQVGHYVQEFLHAAKKPWPGIENLWNGRATLSTPWRAPNLLGSYSCWMVGQYTKFGGSEGLRQGNCHFAGEHCSQGFQGFMEGGATEGARAAQEIIADLG